MNLETENAGIEKVNRMRVQTRNDRLSFAILLLLASILTLHPFGDFSHGAEREAVRCRAGLDLFPSLLAADLNIRNKTGRDGKLCLLLLHANNPEKAKEFAAHLTSVGRIRGLPIRVDIAVEQSFDQYYKDQTIAGIFLTQPLSHRLNSIIAFAREHRCILFSPFEGDVERGVSGGMHISDRVLPYLNISALKAANIQIKSFFLRVSMRHEEE